MLKEDLAKFGVGPLGFLPTAPLTEFPDPYFAPWHELALALPRLLGALSGHSVKDAVDALPELDAGRLKNDDELELAMLALVCITSAYVFEDEAPRERLPRQVAVPLWAVAERLGREPILAHGSIVLRNWQRLDASKAPALGNISTIYQLYGGPDEAWFYLVTVEVERVGAELIPLLCDVQQAVANGEVERCTALLAEIAEILERVEGAFMLMHDKCDPHIFYHRVRRFLQGWKNNAALPNGLVYEGANDDKPVFLAGGSAAQSSLLQSIDAALGVEHPNEASARFLESMRENMPSKHREFIQELQLGGDAVRVFADQHAPVEDAYKAAMAALASLRSKHINMAARYILPFTKKGMAFPEDGQGTGGTSFVRFLKGVRDDCKMGRDGVSSE